MMEMATLLRQWRHGNRRKFATHKGVGMKKMKLQVEGVKVRR
jgi:hypothetical protein